MNNSEGTPAQPTLWKGQLQRTGTFGLTKREHFAGLAMQGLLAHYGNANAESCAPCAVALADALLKELETSHE